MLSFGPILSGKFFKTREQYERLSLFSCGIKESVQMLKYPQPDARAIKGIAFAVRFDKYHNTSGKVLILHRYPKVFSRIESKINLKFEYILL